MKKGKEMIDPSIMQDRLTEEEQNQVIVTNIIANFEMLSRCHDMNLLPFRHKIEFIDKCLDNIKTRIATHSELMNKPVKF